VVPPGARSLPEGPSLASRRRPGGLRATTPSAIPRPPYEEDFTFSFPSRSSVLASISSSVAYAVISTESGALSVVPSLTTRVATYIPATSATKVGLTMVASESVAALPSGGRFGIP